MTMAGETWSTYVREVWTPEAIQTHFLNDWFFNQSYFPVVDAPKGLTISTGYDYAVEKAGSTRGWSFTMYEEAWNYGFPQEMQHFVDCILAGEQPLETGEDGRAVMEIIFAAYESAGTGRKVELPFTPPPDATPIELWRR